jgi:hypothetical protein
VVRDALDENDEVAVAAAILAPYSAAPVAVFVDLPVAAAIEH